MRALVYLSLPFALMGCGLLKYPGQPGIATNGYSKIDLEDLQVDGLYVYEAVYDNRPGGQGVGALITRLYRNAQTYTSNVRTNADGTLYRVKGAYEGSEVQMISIPKLSQIHISPSSTVQFFIEQDTSLDEVDDQNLAEASIFKPISQPLSQTARLFKEFRWQWLRAGSLLPTGQLSYQVTALSLGAHTYTPATPVSIETNFFQNAIRTNVTPALRQELGRFLEMNFPNGYQGSVKLHVKGAPAPLEIRLGVHTVKTAQASGFKIVPNASEALARAILEKFSSVQ